jgi:glycosyltransferase involved in cell wall biosynthesis
VVGVKAPGEAGELELTAVLRGRDGHTERTSLGRIAIVDRDPSPRLEAGAVSELIAVCMSTFDPDLRLFRAQVESLRAQTDERWICIVSDDCSSPDRFREMLAVIAEDSRFAVSRNERRVGFYRNFERALEMVPAEASLVALCDQDDRWHPDKLAVLRDALGSAMLAYSDQRLVDEHGQVLRETLWRGRRNNFTDLSSLLIANTVTGAAALFRREVLERALPFPDSPGNDFHDHWIALVALAIGPLAYVDRPLYDYVQHTRAVLGDRAASEARPAQRRIRPPQVRRWRAAYFIGYVPGEVRARTLLLRCADRLSEDKRRALERYLASATSSRALAWLLLRPLRMLAGRTETLASEWLLAKGIIWVRLASLIARVRWWPDALTLDTRLPDPATFEQKRLRRWRDRG